MRQITVCFLLAFLAGFIFSEGASVAYLPEISATALADAAWPSRVWLEDRNKPQVTWKTGKLLFSRDQYIAHLMPLTGRVRTATETSNDYRLSQRRAVSLATLRAILATMDLITADMEEITYEKKAWEDKASVVKAAQYTMREVNVFLVKPFTFDSNKGITLAQKAGGSLPTFFISHSWDSKFHDFIRLVSEHFATLHEAQSEEETYYWVCTFANEQHSVTVGEMAIAPEFSTSPFIQAMERASGGLVSLNTIPTKFSLARPWCYIELMNAFKTAQPVAMMFLNGDFSFKWSWDGEGASLGIRDAVDLSKFKTQILKNMNIRAIAKRMTKSTALNVEDKAVIATMLNCRIGLKTPTGQDIVGWMSPKDWTKCGITKLLVQQRFVAFAKELEGQVAKEARKAIEAKERHLATFYDDEENYAKHCYIVKKFLAFTLPEVECSKANDATACEAGKKAYPGLFDTFPNTVKDIPPLALRGPCSRATEFKQLHHFRKRLKSDLQALDTALESTQLRM